MRGDRLFAFAGNLEIGYNSFKLKRRRQICRIKVLKLVKIGTY